MSKSAYTDEEIKNVFHALFTEKKKIKELEQQLAQLRKKEPTEAVSTPSTQYLTEENEQLKHTIAQLKKKIEETDPASISSDAPSHWEQKATFQEENIKGLEELNVLLDEENRAFLKQLENLKGLLVKARDETQQATQLRIEKETSYEQLKAENHRIQDELVKQQISSNQAQQETAPKADFENLHKENQHLQKRLSETENQYKVAQETITELKLESASRQAAENSSSKADLDSLRQENNILHKALTEAEEQNHRQKIRLEKLAQSIQEKEKRIHELHQYEFTHKKTSEQRQSLQTTLEDSQKEIDNLRTALNENQQHTEQLERVIKFLRERSEEGQLASKQFKEDYEASQAKISNLEKELQETRELLNGIKHAHQHTQSDKQELAEEIEGLHTQLTRLKRSATESESGSQELEVALKETEKQHALEKQHVKKLTEQVDQQNALIENTRKEIDIIKQALVRGMREANELEARFKESVQERVAALNKFHHARQLLDKQEQQTRHLQDEFKQYQKHAEHQLEQALQLCHAQEANSKITVEEMQQAWQQDKTAAVERELKLTSQFEEERHTLETAHQKAIQKAHEELRNLKDQHQTRVNEHLQQIYQLKQEVEHSIGVAAEKQSLLEQYEQLKSELSQAAHRLNETLNVRQEMEQQLQVLSEKFSENKQQQQSSQEHINQLIQEKQQLQNNLDSSHSTIEEKDSHIQMAQQHLAKKVKEAAHLTEEVEKNKQHIHELQQQHMQYQIRTAELQASLDIHIQQEKRLQEQLSEVIRSYDTQAKKWEHKYFEVHDKWQATELRKKELEKLEERHMQMQALLANLGSVMGAPVTPTQQQSTYTPQAPLPSFNRPVSTQSVHIAETPYTSKGIEHTETETIREAVDAPKEEGEQRPYQNLFNMPKAPEKPRQNLFD